MTEHRKDSVVLAERQPDVLAQTPNSKRAYTVRPSNRQRHRAGHDGYELENAEPMVHVHLNPSVGESTIIRIDESWNKKAMRRDSFD